ncbi:MAG: hypothetical protein RJB26_327 [Pseudomonadota bacterium]|jgi:aspartyl/asparaginyl beta-hydroxylase (cupin superfamily)
MKPDAARLNQAIQQALARGDLRGAEQLLLQWLEAEPGYLAGWLGVAGIRRQLGRLDEAMAAVHRARALDPRHFQSLLMEATLLDRMGNEKLAARAYGIALFQAPPDTQLDPATRQAVQRGREVHAKYQTEITRFVSDSAATAQAQCSGTEKRRIDQFIGISLRTQQRYQQDPLEYYYPGLPSVEFFEREQFPWLEAFEAETPAMRAELEAAMAGNAAEFTPYVQYDKHLPLDQWAELNHNPDWTSYNLYREAKPIPEHVARAPRTFAAVQKIPQAFVPRRSPVALFSVLQPHTHIPPHTGIANFRLLVHLPLVLPGNCRFRVGNQTRDWQLGQAWVFDDTIEHEAWNDSDKVRVILICDIWNPFLSPEERTAIAAVIAATDTFNGTQPTASA